MLYKRSHCHPQYHQEQRPLICLWFAVLKNARFSRSRLAGYDLSNEGIAITNGFDFNRVKLLFVNKCHTIFFVWTYDPDVGTIDGPDHTWKVPNFIKLSLDTSQVLGNDRKCRFCCAMALETSWTTVQQNTETPNKSPITLWKIPVA